MSDSCQTLISSEEIAELLVFSSSVSSQLLNTYQGICSQQISGRYHTVYTPISRLPLINTDNLYYGIFPKLYTEMSTTALEISGITTLINQPALNLKGQGVLIGIVDSGIDYTHPAFRNPDGTTRILRLWDQTMPSGPTPSGIAYGTEYTDSDINRALSSPDPYTMVPSRDSSGHGTGLAGVAGGSEDVLNSFSGAAPAANFIVVKLKEAKNFFRRFYFYESESPVYQENDIMLGINYLRQCALDLQMPLSIAFGLGCSLGGHDGSSSLCDIINSISFFPNACICVPTGNLGISRLHYQGTVANPATPDIMELSIAPNVPGLILELWGRKPALLSISVQTPGGEFIPRIPARLGEIENLELIFDNSRLSVYYNLIEPGSGEQIVFIRIQTPSPGIWQFGVYSDSANTTFDAFLSDQNVNEPSVYFLEPSPFTTLTDPATAENGIAVSGYNTITGAFYPESGRGFARTFNHKPDICSPCTDITVPNLRGAYSQRSGTSLAAALTAGACAQFMTWAVTYDNLPLLSSEELKSFLIRGASRENNNTLPSPLWGYGTLNVFESFRRLRNL